MKTTLPPPTPAKPHTQDPFQRLSLAVKKLDQLINRTHQLGTLTNQLLREDTTGPRHPSSETDQEEVPSSCPVTTSPASEKLSEV